MRRSFTSIKLLLLVGVGGGIPGFKLKGIDGDTRLGGVAVSLHSKKYPAAVQYDFGKSIEDGFHPHRNSQQTSRTCT
jgi:hypothetical protein